MGGVGSILVLLAPFLALLLAVLTTYPSTYQFGSSAPSVHVYYDPSYPNNWLSRDDSLFLVRYLSDILEKVGVNVVIVDADHLGRLLSEGVVKILVMSQDVAPSTVWNGRGDSLLVRWVRGGGFLVWSGDVELWYISYPNGSKREVGDQTHLLYDSKIVGFVDAEKCELKVERYLIPDDVALPTHSARPVIGGGGVLEVFGSCVIGGVRYYDPALVRAGKGLVLRAFMSGGETNIVVRAAVIAKIVAEKLLGITLDFQKLRKMSFPKVVIGEYHNWYSTGPEWIHWSWHGPGPRRDPERIVDGRRELASAHYPLVGPYDSRDERLIEYHIKIAKAAGIDVFAIDWYGPNSFEDSSINKYLDIAAKLNLSIAIEYEPKIRIEWGSGPREYRVNMVISDLKYVLSRYAKHPAYFRIGGKPVIFYFWPSQLKLEEWVFVFNKLKEEGFEAIHITEGTDPHLLSVFDCIYEWEPLWIKDANITAWDRLREISFILRAYSRLYPDKCFLAGVWPGFDNVGVYGWGFGVTKYDRMNGKVYEEQWKVVLETNPDMVMVTTFNDWNEGTEIEPSMEHGFKYMNITRVYSWLYKKGAKPPPYEKPSTIVTPSIEGNVLKIKIDNHGDIVAVKAEVELKDGYSGIFLSYAQPANVQKLVAIVPYIGTEKYVFTIVLNKTPNNVTIPITVTFYDVVGNYYEQRLFIDKATFMITTIKITTIIQERILTKIETITQTASMTEIITSTIIGSEALPIHMIVIPLAMLPIPIIVMLAIYLLTKKRRL